MSKQPADTNPPSAPGEFPQAEIRDAAYSWWRRAAAGHLWWLTAACLILAIYLIVATVRARGPEIAIHFQQGHGIKPGDLLRHRGIAIGEVTSVELDKELSGITVRVAMEPRAIGLARAGSRFWIVRPRISLGRVSGLETVVGAKYIGVLPGPPDAEKQVEFTGAESPLMMLDTEVVDITIRFRQGYGLSVGDPIKYRGIEVGEVTAVELNEDQNGVDVAVRLLANASRLARVGSQFWVARPDIDLTGIRGLETVVSGRYIAVLPGPEETEPLTKFHGLDSAPPSSEREPGGLEIVLYTPHRGGLQRGVPVMYRGIRIGHVMTAGLSSDATTVEARAYIQPAYRELVHEKTVFWNQTGIDFHFGVTGVDFKADSLSSVALGAVAMATPDSPGKRVTTGHRFSYHAEAKDEWLTWQPSIPVGSALLPEGMSLPQPLRATLLWQERTLGIKRDQEKLGWVLPLADNRLIGPTDLLTPTADAVEKQATLEVAGRKLTITADTTRSHGALAEIAVDKSFPTAWPIDRLRAPTAIEECLIVGATQEDRIPLPAARLEAEEGNWKIDPSLPIDPDWHGASVLAVSDGKLIGVLTINQASAQVTPLTEKLVFNDP